MSYLIYGKRTGMINPETGQPVFDKTFRALDSQGCRVTKLTDAMAYATREDAQEQIDKPVPQKRIKEGIVQFEIRKAK